MGYKAAVQLLKKADDLKIKVSQKCDLLTDSDAWTDQQKLQTVYHQVLVLDLEYALDKKVEQELWTLGFKNHITSLQELSRDKKNPKRSEAQALLSWCLEAASGFYLALLQELCTSFGLDLPFRRRGAVYGHIRDSHCSEQNQTQPSSCLYIVQYCLVHLGDLARYRNQRKQAESFYKQAILVSPTSGQPYNQLALLEASQGNKLSTAFHYVRGIAVKNPFPASVTNLSNAYSTAIDKEGPITTMNTKMTSCEFTQLFLCVHGLLHTTSDLTQAELGVKSMNATLTALVATQSFTADRLLEMTVINLYAWKHVNTSKREDLTEDEVRVRELVLDLLAGSLSAFLLPVHTLTTDESLLDYYALPAVKFLTYWIRDEPEVLTENKFGSRLQIWPSLCKFLNSVQPFLENFDSSKHVKTPLPEDRDMQGFLPLAKPFADLDFKMEELEDVKALALIRTHRIVEFGSWLVEHDGVSGVNVKPIIIKEKTDKCTIFEPGCVQPDPTENLLEEMKSFSVIEVVEEPSKLKSIEKRGGILKPQGSLEKSREEREKQESAKDVTVVRGSDLSGPKALVGKVDPAKLKRVRQNVALQSIFKKMEENKQVKFSVDATDKEKDKSPKSDPKPPPPKPAPPTGQPFRTQTFNQNHPALSTLQGELPKELLAMNFPNQPMMNFDNRGSANKSFPMAGSAQLPYNPAASGMAQPPPGGYNVGQSQVLAQSQPMPYNPNASSYPQFNAWKPNEGAQQVANAPSWPWSTMNPQVGQNFQQPQPAQDNYQMNYPFGAGNPMGYYDMNKGTAGPGQQGQGTGMYSPWNNQRNVMQGQPMMGYDGGPAQNMSMRQAMLKETASMPGIGGFGAAPPRGNAVPQNNQDYSLFNANGWNPNLPGQLKNTMGGTDANAMRNQSLFAGQGGPQSLAQLLEQQNQWQKSDK